MRLYWDWQIQLALAVEITAIKHITTCVYVHVELIKYSKVDCEEF